MKEKASSDLLVVRQSLRFDHSIQIRFHQFLDEVHLSAERPPSVRARRRYAERPVSTDLFERIERTRFDDVDDGNDILAHLLFRKVSKQLELSKSPKSKHCEHREKRGESASIFSSQ